MQDDVRTLDTGLYEALKQKVQHLKREQHFVSKTKVIAKELEAAAILTLRENYEETISELTEGVKSAQQQLKQNTERSAKLRQHHEREKKSLLAQVEKSKEALEAVKKEQECILAQEKQSFQDRLEAVKKELENLQEKMIAEREKNFADRKAAIDEIDAWCTGEVEAVRSEALKKVETATEQAEKWRRSCEEQKQENGRLLKQLLDERKIASEKSMQIQMEAAALKEKLKEASFICDEQATKLDEYQKQVDEEATAHAAQLDTLKRQHGLEVQDLKAVHAQQLDLINSRMQQVVEKKNSTIATLREELQGLAGKLHQLEGFVMQEGMSPRADHTASYQ